MKATANDISHSATDDRCDDQEEWQDDGHCCERDNGREDGVQVLPLACFLRCG